MGTNSPVVIKWAEINATSSGDTSVIAAVSGKKIRVTAITLVCSAAVGVGWKSGSNIKINAMPFAQNGGMALEFVSPAHFFVETNAGEALIINLSVNSNVRGSLNYEEIG